MNIFPASGVHGPEFVPEASVKEQLEAVLNRECASLPKGVGCTVVVMQKGKEPSIMHAGTSEVNAAQHWGSVSKQFTAAAIKELVQQQKLDWKDDIRKHIPDLPEFSYEGRPCVVTVDDLLHMRSGLPEVLTLAFLSGCGGRDEQALSVQEKLSFLHRFPELAFEPGKEMMYCNTNYYLLALAAENVTKQSFPDLMNRLVFKPLEMHCQLSAESPKCIPGYDPEGRERTTHDKTWGATGVIGAPSEMVKWNRALDDGIQNALLEPYPHVNEPEPTYCRGISIAHVGDYKVAFHAGGIDGFCTQFMRYENEKDPQKSFAFFVAMNVENIGLNERLTDQIANTLAGTDVRIERLGPPPPAPARVAKALLEPYEGSYRCPVFDTNYTVQSREHEEGVWALHLTVLGPEEGKQCPEVAFLPQYDEKGELRFVGPVGDVLEKTQEGFTLHGAKAAPIPFISTTKTKEQEAVVHGIRPTIRLPGSPEKVHIVDRMKELGIHGVSIAAFDAQHLWCETFGNAEDEKSLFQAASISKTVTALTIMSLFEDLDTDVSTILDEKLWDSIDPEGICADMHPKMTIRQLLSHTAGLRKDTKEGYPGYEPTMTSLPSLDDILMGTGTNSPPVTIVSKPGESCAYSGGGSMILQKIIEIVAGDYKAAVQKHVFGPLKLKDSHFALPDGAKPLHGDGKDRKPLPFGWHVQPELAAAGLWTTARDLAKLAIAIQKGSLIGKDHAKEMLKVQNKNAEQLPGLGVFIEEYPDAKYFYHSGSNLGFRCLMVANSQGQGAVVMTNSDQGNDIIPEVVRAVAEVYDWKDRDKMQLEFPPLDPALANPQSINPVDWCATNQGRYQFDDNFVEIKLSGNRAVLLDNGISYDITPLSMAAGAYQETTPGPQVPLTFHKNDDGTLSLIRYGAPHVNPTEWAKKYLGDYIYENQKVHLSEKDGHFFAQIAGQTHFELWPTPTGFRDAIPGPPKEMFIFAANNRLQKLSI